MLNANICFQLQKYWTPLDFQCFFWWFLVILCWCECTPLTTQSSNPLLFVKIISCRYDSWKIAVEEKIKSKIIFSAMHGPCWFTQMVLGTCRWIECLCYSLYGVTFKTWILEATGIGLRSPIAGRQKETVRKLSPDDVFPPSQRGFRRCTRKAKRVGVMESRREGHRENGLRQ